MNSSFMIAIIVAVPLLVLPGIAVYARKHVRGVADFLAAGGRIAGNLAVL